MDDLCRWTAAQRDEIDGLAGRIITRKEARPANPGQGRSLSLRIGLPLQRQRLRSSSR